MVFKKCSIERRADFAVQNDSIILINVYIYIFGNILFGWNRGYLIFLIIVKDFLKISFHIFWGDKRKRSV